MHWNFSETLKKKRQRVHSFCSVSAFSQYCFLVSGDLDILVNQDIRHEGSTFFGSQRRDYKVLKSARLSPEGSISALKPKLFI